MRSGWLIIDCGGKCPTYLRWNPLGSAHPLLSFDFKLNTFSLRASEYFTRRIGKRKQKKNVGDENENEKKEQVSSELLYFLHSSRSTCASNPHIIQSGTISKLLSHRILSTTTHTKRHHKKFSFAKISFCQWFALEKARVVCLAMLQSDWEWECSSSGMYNNKLFEVNKYEYTIKWKRIKIPRDWMKATDK